MTKCESLDISSLRIFLNAAAFNPVRNVYFNWDNKVLENVFIIQTLNESMIFYFFFRIINTVATLFS